MWLSLTSNCVKEMIKFCCSVDKPNQDSSCRTRAICAPRSASYPVFESAAAVIMLRSKFVCLCFVFLCLIFSNLTVLSTLTASQLTCSEEWDTAGQESLCEYRWITVFQHFCKFALTPKRALCKRIDLWPKVQGYLLKTKWKLTLRFPLNDLMLKPRQHLNPLKTLMVDYSKRRRSFVLT